MGVRVFIYLLYLHGLKHYKLSDQIFIFFAGIAISTGLAYLWLGITERNYRASLFFGLFAISAGFYFVLSSSYGYNPVALFFATSMFIFFPWYFAYESGYIRKPVLWGIVGLGLLYFISNYFAVKVGSFGLEYLFSYAVYILTSFYCFASLKKMVQSKKNLIWPFFVVTIYYALFVSEEIAYNFLGNSLPWRKLFSITYLDLFPVIIISMHLIILVYNRLEKAKLEKSIDFNKNNFTSVLNQTKTFVTSINLEGSVLFANPYFLDHFDDKRSLEKSNFCELISPETLDQFKTKVFNKAVVRGNVITKLMSSQGEITIAWSFVKLKESITATEYSYIYLFGNNITGLIETEENLRIAYEDLEELKNELQAENIQLRNESIGLGEESELIGESPNFNYVINRIEDVATLDVPVLLEGETGVGKELFANVIHKESKRNENPYVKVNCAAIPENLIESELFGFEKGAFTGADRLKKGMFELANGGTLFLDEIGDLPLNLQPKLLRAIQENEIQRLGAEKVIKIDIRIIAATNLNLADEVEHGRFRSDLFYRINVFPITIPPLRRRKSDIPLLVHSFVASFNKKYAKNIEQVSESLMANLTNHPWPGNVRQLKNVIERSMITSEGRLFKLVEPLPTNGHNDIKTGISEQPSLATLEDCEKNHIVHVLTHCKWKISGKGGAAQILNLPASTLRSKMKKLGIVVQH